MGVSSFVKKYKKDTLFTAVIVLTGIALLIAKILFTASGNSVAVRVDGTEYARYSLEKEAVYEIQGYNHGVNILIISEGMAYISEATCPDGLCTGMGRISERGESIICLPNRVVVEIE